MAKKLRKASTILLKMILYDLGYTLISTTAAANGSPVAQDWVWPGDF
jgi:hypothetical protein